MIYYESDKIRIRDMEPRDAQTIAAEEIAQGWDASADKYEMRLEDRKQGKAVAMTAEYEGNAAGYVNVYFHTQAGAFVETGYPEIVDFGVLEKYRRRGIGGKLMDIAEKIAAEHADTVCIGVGLHHGYGSAQRMYVKRGYVPDGSGVWYRGAVCGQYENCCNDDELILYLSKKLSNGGR